MAQYFQHLTKFAVLLSLVLASGLLSTESARAQIKNPNQQDADYSVFRTQLLAAGHIPVASPVNGCPRNLRSISRNRFLWRNWIGDVSIRISKSTGRLRIVQIVGEEQVRPGQEVGRDLGVRNIQGASPHQVRQFRDFAMRSNIVSQPVASHASDRGDVRPDVPIIIQAQITMAVAPMA